MNVTKSCYKVFKGSESLKVFVVMFPYSKLENNEIIFRTIKHINHTECGAKIKYKKNQLTSNVKQAITVNVKSKSKEALSEI